MADPTATPATEEKQNARMVVHTPGEPLTLSHTEIPSPPPGGVVIKLHYSGVCHSDLHIASRAIDPRLHYPRVLGHEMCGEIHSLGDGFTATPELKVGAPVSLYPWGQCGDCPFCAADVGMCRKGAFDFEGMSLPNWFSINKDGGFQQYLAVDNPRDLVPLPPGLPHDVAALTCCSGLTATHAAQVLAPSIAMATKVKGHAVVAVAGAGGLAWWAIQILRATHGSDVSICAIDVVEEKLEYARQAGADKVFQWSIEGDSVEISKQLTASLGDRVDAAIDFVCVPSTMERLFYSLDVNATVALVGLGGAGGANLPPVPATILAMRNATVRGVQCGTPEHMRHVQELVVSGKVKPPPIIHVTLAEVNDVMRDMKEGKVLGRAVIKF